MSQLNEQIKAAIDAGNTEQARTLLRDAMSEANAETYFLASQVALSEKQKQDFLNKAIDLDPFYEQAHSRLKTAQPTVISHVTLEADTAKASSGIQIVDQQKSRNRLFVVSSWLSILAIGSLVLGLILAAFEQQNSTIDCSQYQTGSSSYQRCNQANDRNLQEWWANEDERNLRNGILFGGFVVLSFVAYGLFVFAKRQEISRIKAEHRQGGLDDKSYEATISQITEMRFNDVIMSVVMSLFRGEKKDA